MSPALSREFFLVSGKEYAERAQEAGKVIELPIIVGERLSGKHRPSEPHCNRPKRELPHLQHIPLDLLGINRIQGKQILDAAQKLFVQAVKALVAEMVSRVGFGKIPHHRMARE